MNFDELLFPHKDARDIQGQLIIKIDETLKKGGNLLVHAPTGLGKTAAALAPCLKYAIDNNKTVFFLTSRHTQHKIAIDTLKEIKKKYEQEVGGISIIGKKGLCLQPGVHTLYTGEFHEYCKAMREDKKCDFYENIKKKDQITTMAKSALSDLKVISPVSTEDTMEVCGRYGVCPYEISLMLAKKSKVIIGDYYYLFHPDISKSFFKKIEIELEDAIIIVDEAHNLPDRVKDLFSARLTNLMIKRAISEAKKYKYQEISERLEKIERLLHQLCNFDGEEKYVKKENFVNEVNQIIDYDELTAELALIGDKIREDQKQSSIGSIADFLEGWLGKDDGFTRILSKKYGLREPINMLSYRCMDPSLATRTVIDQAYSTIMMSGTFTPTSMYKELLGFEDADEETYKSPFPQENKLNIIIPKTSTKYELRSAKQYKEIAEILSKIVNIIPGNSAIFFTSYYLRDQIYKEFNDLCIKTIFLEHPGFSKQEKQDLLERFKGYKDVGATLLGVISGSFSEGIDLPGDYLKGVIIVGLPLTKPDLETKALIEYYDRKFAKGWDYGYLYPAFNKTLQSAGRCIRSETDKGVIIFLDERYAWNNYRKCFPESWDIKVTLLYERLIKEFFDNN